MSIFQKDQAWHVPEELNLVSMMEACKVLVGHHDFSSFRATGCQAISPMKTLDELHVCEMPAWPCFPSPEDRKLSPQSSEAKDLDNSTSVSMDPILRLKQGTQEKLRCFVVTARARSFLYHQVRLLVGTLKAVGSGALTVQDVKRILDGRDITQVPAMASACGLYLAHVKYDFSDDNELGPNMMKVIEGRVGPYLVGRLQVPAKWVSYLHQAYEQNSHPTSKCSHFLLLLKTTSLSKQKHSFH